MPTSMCAVWFVGSLPAAWGTMTKISNLRLSGNELTGTLLPAWGAMSTLTALSLDGNLLQVRGCEACQDHMM